MSALLLKCVETILFVASCCLIHLPPDCSLIMLTLFVAVAAEV